MGMLVLVRATADFRARRERAARELPKGMLVETWRDVFLPDLFWMGEETKAALDAGGAASLPAVARVDEEAVPIWRGTVEDAESLPPPRSIRTRTLAGHGIAVAWVQSLKAGARLPHEPTGPEDAFFYLMRMGGSPNHLWRLFRSRADAQHHFTRALPADAAAAVWAETLPHEDYGALLRSFNPDAPIAQLVGG
ncbi:MAG TPA: hypothetical protein VED18_06125 [Candidatus Sulfotelmatobacter sp.]|nr:hypothetical protein [Candidatus Sulfotelmatobacter sp.]